MNPTREKIINSRLFRSGKEFTCLQMVEEIGVHKSTVTQMLNTMMQSGTLRERLDTTSGPAPQSLYHAPILAPLIVRRPWGLTLAPAIEQTLESARA